MGVYIKNMKMPDDVLTCPLNNSFGMCHANVKGPNNCLENSGNNGAIPDWCPLRPLPEKHGRLIDADALPRYTGYALSADEVAQAVENAPTIIEAEGE